MVKNTIVQLRYSFGSVLWLVLLVGMVWGITPGSLEAQRESHYSLYMLNPFAYNPAFAGMDYSLSATGVFRRQWVGVDNTPSTQQVNMHMPFDLLRGGIGLNFDNDVFGAEQYMRFGFAYTYQLEMGSGILSLGARANLVQRTLDGSKLRTPEGFYTDGVIDHRDPILTSISETGSASSCDIGIYFKSERVELGVGIANIAESQVALSQANLKNIRTIAFNAGYHLELTGLISLHPSVFVQSDLTQTQLAGSLLISYNDNIFGGATFRGYNVDSRDAVAITAGFKLSEKVKLGYAYDVTLSEFKQVSTGSHEILLNYNLNRRVITTRPPRVIFHPRAF